jgi:(1->4)-alpha-D-glucan 1-alpha-D-glucosylmutase
METLVPKVLAALRQRQVFPEATYRLQFHAGFTFQHARALVPYLHELGITHIYASSYLKARPGSQHGYDITNHQLLNPEIGTLDDYQALVNTLHDHGMGQILDMVPNHMGIAGNDNPWWNDVLENGPASPYSTYFDIDWQSSTRSELHDKVLLPILGDTYGRVLESGQLRLQFEAGTFTLHYFDHRFPLAPQSYALVLKRRFDDLELLLGEGSEPLTEYQSILTAIRNLPAWSEQDPMKLAEYQREKDVIKRRLATLAENIGPVRDFIQANLVVFNGDPADPTSFDLLDHLLSEQAYRLAYWRVAADEINYRRFFDINELAALSMERPEVFEATHALVLALIREGKVNGLRIDHPDGLFDPKQYLQRLQLHVAAAMAPELISSDAALGRPDEAPNTAELMRDFSRWWHEHPESALEPPLYLVVEKILGRDETLQGDWPVHGTSGYDFLNMVNGLFVDTAQAGALSRIYYDWIQDKTPFGEKVYEKKYLILQVGLSSELQVLSHQLDHLAQRHRASRDFTLTSLRHALLEIIACFPVYRSYISEEGIHPADRAYVQLAVARAKRRNPVISASLFDYVRDVLLLEYPGRATEADRQEQRRFVGKFQQVTAPVMAKGVEDTAFYVYNRLLSLNEVGGDPGRFGVSRRELHRFQQERQARWPWSLSASSTHDTKRSEDIRARLNVLSELPDEWRSAAARWHELNAGHFENVDDMPVPGADEEYFFYQTLVGAWPVEPCPAKAYRAFVDRIAAYMEKAMHEAKVHTSWINPNPPYDEAMRRFVTKVLDPAVSEPFLSDLRAWQQRISHYGFYNSLAQTLLKICSPGVPDTYLGSELWDFSLVDPDNRRPVDFALRRRLLADLNRLGRAATERVALVRSLLKTKDDGRIKLFVTQRALQCRRANAGLFTKGDYVPLEAEGPQARHVFSFLRSEGSRQALVAVPRLLVQLGTPPDGAPVGEAIWHNSILRLPLGAPAGTWRDVFTGNIATPETRGDQRILFLAEVFRDFPVALLLAGA